MKPFSIKSSIMNLSETYLKAVTAAQVHAGEAFLPMVLFGGAMVVSSTSEFAYGQDGTTPGTADIDDYNKQLMNQICKVIYMTQGGFGALVMSVAGLVAIIAAAVGSYRSALNAIAVGAGAYMVRPMIMLFFGDVPCGKLGFNIPIFGGISIPGVG